MLRLPQADPRSAPKFLSSPNDHEVTHKQTFPFPYRSNMFSCRILPKLMLAGLFAVVLPQSPAAENILDIIGGPKWAYNPGYEFPGAKGDRRFETVDGRESLVVKYDFTDGGAYVIVGTRVEIAEGASELRFDVRADRNLKIVVRLEDAEKQTHQYNLLYETPDRWQTLSLDLKATPPKSFGGSADGVMHYPISKFWVGIGKGSTALEPGEIAVSRIRTLE